MTEDREDRLAMRILVAGIGVGCFGIGAILLTQAVQTPTGPIDTGGALEISAEPLELIAGGWMDGGDQ